MVESNQQDRGFTGKQWLFGSAVVIALLLLLIYGVERYLEQNLQGKLQDAGHDFRDSNYELELGDLQLSLWGQDLTVSDLEIFPTSTGMDSAHIAPSRIKTIAVKDIGLISYFWGDTLSIGEIVIHQPDLILKGRVRRTTEDDTLSPGSKTGKKIPAVKIGSIQVVNGSARILHPSDSTEEAAIDHLDVQVQGVTIDPSTVAQLPFLRFDSIDGEVTGFHTQTPGNFYDISLRKFSISSSDSTAALDSLVVTPRHPKYKFAQQYGFEIDRIDLAIPQIRLHGLQSNQLLHNRFEATYLELKNAEMEVFHDKHMPASPKKRRPLLHEALARLPFTVELDSVSVEGSQITYTEHRPRVPEPGSVIFGDLNAKIYNLSNDSLISANEKSIILEAHSAIMNSAPLSVRATFPMHNTDMHSLEGSLGEMSMQQLNPVLEPLGFVSITSGQIHSMEFKMDLTTEAANGRLLLNYSGLKIEVLKPEQVDKGGDKELLSMLVNIKVKSENRSQPLREGEISFKRDPQKSIFNYWWKSLLSGLKSTIGL
ncbi:DUF748 domain-containing protein [Aliifodinibius sp. S!AR15-10]|uniref:DUF748 domain-containing protein n=1 Tax=Aliifodinibius sp. S!AR15-10 TaxID=2950437 RepID=UPI00285F0F06|nr:DUF748 domain-containing protein [Aliifodinibius sp. S!AR15-10]MDR8390105.1 DUF748 domain-containing protein [Aliifodinibius sp. S!AR15-10]